MWLARHSQLSMSHHRTHVRIAMWGDGRFHTWIITLIAVFASVIAGATSFPSVFPNETMTFLDVVAFSTGIFVWVWGALLVLGALHAFLLRRTVIVAGPHGWEVTVYALFIPLRRVRGQFPFTELVKHEDTYTVRASDAAGFRQAPSTVRRGGLELRWRADDGRQRVVRFAHGLRARSALANWLRTLSRSGGSSVQPGAPPLVAAARQI